MLLSNLLNPTLDYYQQGETSLSTNPRKQNVPGIIWMGSCRDRLSQTYFSKLVKAVGWIIFQPLRFGPACLTFLWGKVCSLSPQSSYCVVGHQGEKKHHVNHYVLWNFSYLVSQGGNEIQEELVDWCGVRKDLFVKVCNSSLGIYQNIRDFL